MLWSLKLRYCVWKHGDYHGLEDATIYVFYFDPKQSSGLAHLLGLQKSLIGVVNAFASKKMKKENHVIIAHELLDTVGAADKYDYSTNQPLYPIGHCNYESRCLSASAYTRTIHPLRCTLFQSKTHNRAWYVL
jgi:hypothetical protein